MTEKNQPLLRDKDWVRWTALMLLAFAMFCSYIFMDILSPIKDLLESTRGWNSDAFGNVPQCLYLLPYHSRDYSG